MLSVEDPILHHKLGAKEHTENHWWVCNLGVIQSASNTDAELSKKHVAISFHVVREAIAAGIVDPHWLNGEVNMSDIITKQISDTSYKHHVENLFWKSLK